MAIPDGVDGTCVLLVFFFLTQVSEEYLVVVMTAEQVRKGRDPLCVSDGILTTLGDMFDHR